MKRGRWIAFLVVIMAMLMLVGCNDDSPELTENTYEVYYLGGEAYSLTTEKREIVGADVKERAFKLLEAMKQPEKVQNSSLFAKAELVSRITVEQGNLLNVYMNEQYGLLSVANEVLLRAGIVKTLVQLEGVQYVAIYVNEQPLIDVTGKTVGIMSAESFLDSRGENLSNYEQVMLTVYYGNAAGTGLTETSRETTISGTFSKERQVVNALLAGPETSDMLATMPQGTSLLSVSVKNNICYVNFSGGFLTGDLAVSPYVTIYSLVNSLTALSNISKVQIMVEGDSSKKFCETIPLDVPFERNLDYVMSGGKEK